VATSAGFEPTTNSLEGCCSIQLSYEAMMHGLADQASGASDFLR
jgi:hypothetical protein